MWGIICTCIISSFSSNFESTKSSKMTNLLPDLCAVHSTIKNASTHNTFVINMLNSAKFFYVKICDACQKNKRRPNQKTIIYCHKVIYEHKMSNQYAGIPQSNILHHILCISAAFLSRSWFGYKLCRYHSTLEKLHSLDHLHV